MGTAVLWVVVLLAWGLLAVGAIAVRMGRARREAHSVDAHKRALHTIESLVSKPAPRRVSPGAPVQHQGQHDPDDPAVTLIESDHLPPPRPARPPVPRHGWATPPPVNPSPSSTAQVGPPAGPPESPSPASTPVARPPAARSPFARPPAQPPAPQPQSDPEPVAARPSLEAWFKSLAAPRQGATLGGFWASRGRSDHDRSGRDRRPRTRVIAGASGAAIAVVLIVVLVASLAGGGSPHRANTGNIAARSGTTTPTTPPPAAPPTVSVVDVGYASVRVLVPPAAVAVFNADGGRCWLYATSSTGQVLYSSVMAAGQSQSFTVSSTLTTRIGDSATLRLTVDGETVALPNIGANPLDITLDVSGSSAS